jgi:diacylglycerol kinase family enzyme
VFPSRSDGQGLAARAAADVHAGERGWIGIVANRGSGMGRGLRLVERLVAELRRLGFRTEIAWTPEARAAMVAAAASDGDCRCLVAVGGDGTVSALLNEQPRPPVTVLPAGTENLVARHFGLRRDPHHLAATIAAGRASRIDVGQAAGRRFLLMAGFGFDADVVTRHHQARITRSGRVRPTHRMAYVEPILRSSWTYRFPTISVRVLDPGAEELIRGTTVFVFNLPRYALGLPVAPIARDDDGWLDLVVFRNPGPFQALYYLLKVFCGIHLDDPSVFHRRVRHLVVTADEPIPVQLDGDPGGYLLPLGGPLSAAAPNEWTIRILPSALTVLTPADRNGRAAGAPLASEDVA